MEEKHSSTTKQFLFVLLWAAFLYIACGTLMSAFGDYAFIGGVIALVVFAVFGYIVLVHYCARFTYSLKNGRLRINRMIGKRNKEVEFACSDITRTAFGEKQTDFSKPVFNMRVSVMNSKNSMYIEYKANDNSLKSVVIEPTEKLRKRIEKERKNTDG